MIMNPRCDHCRWYNGDNGCNAPQNRTRTSRELVDGQRTYGVRWLTCSFMRAMGTVEAFLCRACGMRGRWYQPKQTS